MKQHIDKIQLTISTAIRLTLLLAIYAAISDQRWLVVFISGLTFILTFLPALIERRFKVYLPTELEAVIVLFIYATLFLGGVHGYYEKFWWWDILLHGSSSITLGMVGFLIIYTLYYEKRLHGSALLVAIFSFTFAVAIGSLWEIVEFSFDHTLGTHMQSTGLMDTMSDLIVDSLGAFLTSVAGYFYIKSGRAPLFEQFLHRFIRENPHIFQKQRIE